MKIIQSVLKDGSVVTTGYGGTGNEKYVVTYVNEDVAIFSSKSFMPMSIVTISDMLNAAPFVCYEDGDDITLEWGGTREQQLKRISHLKDNEYKIIWEAHEDGEC